MTRIPRLSVLPLVLLAGCSSGGDGGGGGGPPASASIDLVRDAWGVPHVFAPSDERAYFGLGLACAQDRFFQMSYLRLAATGRVAEFLGPDGGDGSREFADHDQGVRLGGTGRLAARVVAALDPRQRNLLEAYADGVNRYLLPEPGEPQPVLHPLFASTGIAVEPWSAEDSVALWLRFSDFFSPSVRSEVELLHDYEDLLPTLGPDGARAALLPERVFDEQAAVVQQADVPAARRAAMQAYADGLGLSASSTGLLLDRSAHFSSAWAVAGAASTSGEGLLFGDPRLALRVPSTLWEAHVRGATFEVRGVTVPGCVNFISGSNGRVAWSATALGLDQADLFELVVSPATQPGRYLLDGQWVPYLVDEVETVVVRGEAPVQVRYRETVWGPVLTRGPGDGLLIPDVDPGEEFAQRSVRFLRSDRDPSEGFLAMYRADGIVDFAQALGGVDHPSANAIFADDSGRIGYWVMGGLPVREPAAPLGGVGAQDGSRSAADWLDVVPHQLKPGVLDPAANHVYTANHLPVGDWYPIPLASGGGHTSRSARLGELLADLLPGAGSRADPADVRAIHDDAGWTFGRDVVVLGLHLRDRQPLVGGAPFVFDPEALSALALLEPWADAGADGIGLVDLAADGILDAALPAASALARWTGLVPFRSSASGGLVDPALVAQFGRGEWGMAHWLRDRTAGVRSMPPIDLSLSEATFVEAQLVAAWNQMQSLAGAPPSWSAWFIDSHLRKDLKRWVLLEGFPSLEPGRVIPTGPVTAAAGATLLAQFDQGYAQWVVLGPAGRDGASSLLPIGQSEHEVAGGHHDDQRALWEAGPQVLKPSPMSRQGIEDRAGPTSTRQVD